jgi:hypothetical protein
MDNRGSVFSITLKYQYAVGWVTHCGNNYIAWIEVSQMKSWQEFIVK